MLRYIRMLKHRMRVAGKEAAVMLRLNKPLVALKEGRLGLMEQVFALARVVRAEEAKAIGATTLKSYVR